MTRLSLDIRCQVWKLDPPFVIAGEVWPAIDSIVVELVDSQGNVGRSETQGVSYRQEDFETIRAQLESVRTGIEKGVTRSGVQDLLPAGGARNALDVALWDLVSSQQGRPVHKMIGLDRLVPVETVFTIGIKSPEEAADEAARRPDFRQIKIKADADQHLDVIASIRKARPDAELIVDANQSWTFALLRDLTPELQRLNVSVIEQPLPVHEDAVLEGYASPIVLMADESCQDRSDLEAVGRRYGAVNIKLDKTGGLTEAIQLRRDASRMGLKTMVGNMCGGSLAMAPAFLLAQLTDYADIDGPLLQTEDWPNPLQYRGGHVYAPAAPLWGGLHLPEREPLEQPDTFKETSHD